MDNPGTIFAIFTLLVGLLATAGYGLMSVAQYKGARAAFYATAFFLFAIGVELGLVMAWPLYAKIFVAGCFGFVAAGALVYALHSVSLFEKSQATKKAPKETLAALESPKTLDNTISFACAWSKPPSHYREDKTLHIVDFQGVPVSGVDFNRQSAGPMHFIRSSDPFTPSEHYSNMWYRCDVTNHSSQPVRNLWTKFPVVYNAVVSAENGTRSGAMIAAGYARSPMLDLAAGETDYFYFANASAVFVSVLPPSTALLQTMANDTIDEVHVIASSNWDVSFIPSPKPLNANTDLAPQ
jgi:hypothetical protein